MSGKSLAAQVRQINGKGTRHLLPESLRSMQELLELLPRMTVDAGGAIDYQATAPEIRTAIADHATSVAGAFNLGMSAVGSLMAYAAPECDDGTINSDAIEALGWLLAELGATTALMIALSARCRSTRHG